MTFATIKKEITRLEGENNKLKTVIVVLKNQQEEINKIVKMSIDKSINKSG
jgi:hypothetical protein